MEEFDIERLKKYESLGSIQEFEALKQFTRMLKPMMALAERLNALRVHDGKDREPMISRQCYRMLLEISQHEDRIEELERQLKDYKFE